MYKAFKREDGRFEVYEEDAEGNNLGALPETFGTPEEANAKIVELSGAVAAPEEAKVEAPAEQASEDGSKSGEENAPGAEGEQSGNETAPGGEGAGGEGGTGSETGATASGAEAGSSQGE